MRGSNYLRISILSIALVCLISACTTKEVPQTSFDQSMTTVKISHRNNGLNEMLTASGGILIYAVGHGSTNYTESMYLENELDSQVLKIPNGSYKFYAIGYKNSINGSGTITNSMVCANVNSGSPISLTGGAKVISIALNNSDCTSSDDYIPSSIQNSSAVPNLKLHSCSISYTLPNSCVGACSSCAPSNGDIKTYRIKLLNFKKDSSGISKKSGGIKLCLNSPATRGDETTNTFQIPFGNGNSPFAIEVGAYTATTTNCDMDPERTYLFNTGLHSAYSSKLDLEAGSAILQKDGINPVSTHLYLKDNVIRNLAPVATNSVVTTNQNVTYNGFASATDSNGDAMTYSIVSNGTKGTATITNAATGAFQYVPNAGENGLDTFTFKTNDGSLDSNTATVLVRIMNAFTWVGGGANSNWNTVLNWHGGAAPNNTQVAIFDGTCDVDTTCAANKNATLNVDPNVGGVKLNSGYTGTVSQSLGIVFTVGASGYSQAAGTFTGSNATINFAGTNTVPAFVLSGGTFTSSSGVLNIGSNTACCAGGFTSVILNYSGGTFIHNSGTVAFIPSENENGITVYHQISLASDLTLYNANINITDSTFSTPSHLALTGAGNMIVLNNLTHTDGIIYLGTWQLYGNLIISNTADSSTAFQPAAIPTGNITFLGTANQTYTHTLGGKTGDIIINKTAGTVTPNGGTTTCTVRSFRLTAGSFTAPSGVFSLANGWINALFGVNYSAFTVNGGTFIHNSGTISFDYIEDSNASNPTYVVSSTIPLTLNNITINLTDSFLTPSTLNMTGGLTTIAGNLTLTDGAISGSWDVQGNVTVNASSDAGTASITYSGTGIQTYTNAAATANPQGNVVVNKSGGSLNFANNMVLNGAGQDFTISQGTVNMLGFTLDINDVLTLGVGTILNQAGGTLNFGSLSNSGTINP